VKTRRNFYRDVLAFRNCQAPRARQGGAAWFEATAGKCISESRGFQAAEGAPAFLVAICEP